MIRYWTLNCSSNYCLLHHDRSRNGGGLLLYISKDIPFSCFPAFLLELMFVEVKLRQGSHTSCSVLTHTLSFSLSHEPLEDTLASLLPCQLKSIILPGNFNVVLFPGGQASCDLLTMLSSYHLLRWLRSLPESQVNPLL